MQAVRDPAAAGVLDFWFGDGLSLGWPSASRSALWFGGGAELDRQIAERFGPLVQLAAAGGLAPWADHPPDRLALIVLLDQFTRNVFRGQARAFDGDARACALAIDAFDRHWDRDLPMVGQVFLAMPLMHAESVEIQHRCVAEFERMAASAPEAWQGHLQDHLKAAREHRDIVLAFGRYPHRNGVLGRASTSAEVEWLRNGRRFGQ